LDAQDTVINIFTTFLIKGLSLNFLYIFKTLVAINISLFIFLIKLNVFLGSVKISIISFYGTCNIIFCLTQICCFAKYINDFDLKWP